MEGAETVLGMHGLQNLVGHVEYVRLSKTDIIIIKSTSHEYMGKDFWVCVGNTYKTNLSGIIPF